MTSVPWLQPSPRTPRTPALADGLYYAVHCTEDQPGATDYAFDGVPEQLQFLANQQGDRNSLLEICAAMGIADAGGTIRDAATSDIPVLTVSGEFDPVTPCELRGHGPDDACPPRMAWSSRVSATASCCPPTAPRSWSPGFIADSDPGAGRGLHRGHARVQHHRREPQRRAVPDAGRQSRLRTGRPSPTRRPRPAKAPKAKPVKVGLVKVADGFENANGINNAGDKRLFISEQEGYVEVLKPNKDGTFRDAGKFLDIRSRVVCCGEKGFLGIAFPPDYAETGYFYITFAGTGHTWNLEERRVSATDPGPRRPGLQASAHPGLQAARLSTGRATCISAPTATCT